jgi:hypothetical protein
MYFDKLVEDYYKSGLQRKEYCQQNNVNENSFKHRITSYHRSKIEHSTSKEIQSQHQLIEAALEDTKEELIRVEDRCQQLQSQLEDLQRRYDDVNTQSEYREKTDLFQKTVFFSFRPVENYQLSRYNYIIVVLTPQYTSEYHVKHRNQ